MGSFLRDFFEIVTDFSHRAGGKIGRLSEFVGTCRCGSEKPGWLLPAMAPRDLSGRGDQFDIPT